MVILAKQVHIATSALGKQANRLKNENENAYAYKVIVTTDLFAWLLLML